MDEKTLKRLLRAGAPETGSERSSDHPDEAKLAAYVEHRIADEERGKIEGHLADCESCQGQIAFLTSLPEPAAAPVPAGAVARARDLVPDPPVGWRPFVLRWAPAAAGLACVAIVVVAVLRPGTPLHAPASSSANVSVPETGSRKPEAESREPRAESPKPVAESREPRAESPKPAPSVRRSAPAAAGLFLIFPTDSATIAPKNLEFRWQAVPNARYYEISIVTDEGSVVWHGRLEGTRTRLPEGTRLDAGTKYFAWVKAFLADGESTKSATVSFRVAGQ